MIAARRVAMIVLALSLAGSVSAAQDRGTRIDERQVLQLLGSVSTRTARLEKSLGGLFGRNGVNDFRGRDEIRRSLAEFRQPSIASATGSTVASRTRAMPRKRSATESISTPSCCATS